MKKCSKCKQEKELSMFNKNIARKDGKQHACKECEHEYGQKYSARVRDGQLKRRYGISSEEYEILLNKQKSKCAICKTESKKFKKGLFVDHDHKNGKIRGLLCVKCNSALGKFEDDIELLKEAIKYLDKNKELL